MLLIPCLAGRPLELDQFLAEKEALVGAENLIRPCEQDEWIEAMECVNSILAMSGDVLAAQTHDPTLGRTR